MAMFSRTKSKAKRANEQEVLKAAVQETITMPDDAPQRGRKGKEAVRPSQHDYTSAKLPIPGPSQPSRPFQYASDGTGLAHDRNDSFEGSDYLTALNSKQDHCDTTSSSDSGYSSAGPQSRSISRTPTVQREMGCFQISNRSMTQLSLGGGRARVSQSSLRDLHYRTMRLIMAVCTHPRLSKADFSILQGLFKECDRTLDQNMRPKHH